MNTGGGGVNHAKSGYNNRASGFGLLEDRKSVQSKFAESAWLQRISGADTVSMLMRP